VATHIYERRPRKDRRGFDLISAAFHSVASGTANQTRSATQSTTQSFTADHIDTVIRVYNEAGNVIQTHEHAGDFKEW
jgi:uncharacterized membrane-anchored protein